MAPVRHVSLTHALAGLQNLRRADTPVQLRVGLQDGTVLDGTLQAASPTYVTLVLANAQAHHIPAANIRSVHRAHRRPLRMLAVLGLGVVLGTAGVGLLHQIPLLRSHFTTVVGAFLLLGAASAMQLVQHTRLGQWLRSWETLFDGGDR